MISKLLRDKVRAGMYGGLLKPFRYEGVSCFASRDGDKGRAGSQGTLRRASLLNRLEVVVFSRRVLCLNRRLLHLDIRGASRLSMIPSRVRGPYVSVPRVLNVPDHFCRNFYLLPSIREAFCRREFCRGFRPVRADNRSKVQYRVLMRSYRNYGAVSLKGREGGL